VFNVLIIVKMLVCVCLDISRQELGRPVLLEGDFGLSRPLSLREWLTGTSKVEYFPAR